MNRKEQITGLYFILLACFFIPYMEWDSFEMSGFNFILSSHTPDAKYILLLIPFSALLVFSKVKNTMLPRYIPLCAAIILFIVCYKEASEKNIFRVLDYGYWITLAVSLLLIFVEPEVKRT